MERQDGFSGYPNKLARSTTDLTIHQGQDSAGIAAAINASFNNNVIVPNEQQQRQRQLPQGPPPPGPPSAVREQDQYMPIANIIRIMRRVLPQHAKISDDAKETVQECVSEYISFITSEANERCHSEQRKTITAVDLIWAMGKLGFDNYVGPLTLYLNRYRQTENERTSSNRAPLLVPVGPVGSIGPVEPVGSVGPVFNMGPQQGFYDPSVGGFLMDGPGSASGSSSSSSHAANNNNILPGFDPFAQFK